MLDNDYLNYSIVFFALGVLTVFFIYIYTQLKNLVNIISQTKKAVEPISQGVGNINEILQENTSNITNGVTAISETLSSLNTMFKTFIERMNTSGKNVREASKNVVSENKSDILKSD